MKKEETFMLIGILLSIAVLGGAELVSLGSNTETQMHSAQATIDYFSWSCQQLQNQVNQWLNLNPNPIVVNYAPHEQAIDADVLVQIMQLKGCVVNP